MTFKALVLGATASLAFVTSAHATINLGGVAVPDNQEGQATGQVFVDLPTGATDPLSIGSVDFTDTLVFGEVQVITPVPNGAPTFVTNGLQLTYELVVTSATAAVVTGNLATIEVTADIFYYTDSSTPISQMDVTTANDGDLWLSATLASLETIELNLLNGQISASDLEFDVTGGAFAANLDTNFFGGNDFVTFSLQTQGQPDPGTVDIFNGSTNTRFFAVSEPGSLGLLGLGLLGMGVVARRRR